MGFKEAINEYGKEITASFQYCGVTYRDEQIISMNPHYEGSLLKSVMKCLDLELDCELIAPPAIAGLALANASVIGSTTNSKSNPDGNVISSVKFGVKASGDEDYHYIDFGSYIVKESKIDEEQHTISLECYDRMLHSMMPYDLVLDYSVGITVKGYLDAICDRLGWEKGYSTFNNCDVLIDRENYGVNDTFRDVLDDIAEVAGGIIAFVGDELQIIYPTHSGEVITEENLRSLKIGKSYGPINSVVLSRTPQEDNIYRQDTDSVSADGLTEIRIENNQIIDQNREAFMDGICDALFGLHFELYELESFGIGYINLGDLFTIQTADGKNHTALMLCDDMQITQGVSETSTLAEPAVTSTDYSAASETDKMLNQTILRVDKQEGEITAVVTRTKNLETDVAGIGGTVTKMAEVMMDEEAVKIKITEAIEGIDSVQTSTGYTFDKDGLNIHKDGEEMHNTLDNTGMYVRRGNDVVLEANNKGVNAINLTARQYLIVGQNSRFEDYSNGTDTNRTACFFTGG